MIIKVNQSELEVYENSDIYIGLPGKGQSFKKWDELNQNARLELEEIRLKAEMLIRQTEKLLANQ
jgi:hypothetical protein